MTSKRTDRASKRTTGKHVDARHGGSNQSAGQSVEAYSRKAYGASTSSTSNATFKIEKQPATGNAPAASETPMPQERTAPATAQDHVAPATLQDRTAPVTQDRVTPATMQDRTAPATPQDRTAPSASQDRFAPAMDLPTPVDYDALSADGPEIVRERKRRGKKKLTGKKIALIVVAAVVAVLVVSVCAFALSIQNAKKNLQVAADENVSIATPSTAVTYTEGQTVQYNGHTYELNKNIVSLVFIGVNVDNDQFAATAPGQADAVMAVAIDSSTGKVSIISIPRDSMVEVETSATGTSGTYTGMETMQICLSYNYGDGGATSAENTMRAVSRTLYSMPIKYYYALDMSGIGPMTDAIDGVPVTALETIPNTSIEEGDGVILTGNNAVSYVRYRDTSDLESSIARQERQKQFIRAFIKQAMSRAQGNVGDLVTLYNTAQEYSTTNLGVSEFSYLASEMISNGVNDVSVYSLDGTMTLGASGYAEYNLDKDSVYQTVLDVYYTQVS